MTRVEFRIRYKEDIDRGWMELDPVTLGFESRRQSVINRQADAIALAMARGSNKVREVRWNYLTSYQGHYVGRMVNYRKEE